jgi:hypothetical protein
MLQLRVAWKYCESALPTKILLRRHSQACLLRTHDFCARAASAPRRTIKYACGAQRRAPCIHARLRRLVTKPDEKCGLKHGFIIFGRFRCRKGNSWLITTTFSSMKSHFAGYVIPRVGSDIFLFIEFDQLARRDGVADR